MNNVCVLMSTYNGVDYIREQIDSILKQKEIGVTIFVRDDGSSDGTTQILEEYDDSFQNITYINRGVKENKGFNKSFLALLEYGIKNSECDYFAFADQDDVWLEEKLYNALEMVQSVANKSNLSLPIMYYSNKKWVDTSLNFLHEDDMRYCKGNYFDMFMLPPVYGCTTVFNRCLGKMTLEKEMPKELLYDVYMYRLTCLVGGITIADERVSMLYRRHGGNASGDAMKLSPMKHLKNFLKNSSNFHGIQNYVRVIDSNFGERINSEQKKLTTLILGYDTRVDNKLFFIIYRPLDYPDVSKMMSLWRKLANDEGLGDFYFVAKDFDCRDKEKLFSLGFDAIYNDTVLNIHHKLNVLDKVRLKIQRDLGIPTTFKYKDAIKYMITEDDRDERIIPLVAPNWDHSPRSGRKSLILTDSDPKYFKQVLENAMDVNKNKKEEHKIVMIRAWNEWGEGNHLEPDLKYGMGYLSAIKEVKEHFR